MDVDEDGDVDIDTKLGKMRLGSEKDDDSKDSSVGRDEKKDSDDNANEDSRDDGDHETSNDEEDCFYELLQDCIWDVAIDSHRATKLNYFTGKLASLIWKRGSEFLTEKPEPEPEINPDGKKKRTKKKVKTCLCHCCKKELGPKYFANHLSKCLFKSGTYRPGAQKSYVEKSFYSDDDDQDSGRKRKTKSKPRKPAVKSALKKAGTPSGSNSATAKKSTPRGPRKPAYDYPALLDMSSEEKGAFFAEHCGVKLKTSKKNALCSKKPSECQTHKVAERETMRRMHLSIG